MFTRIINVLLFPCIISTLLLTVGIQNAESLEIPYSADFTLRDYCAPCGIADAVDDTDDGFGFYGYVTEWPGVIGEHFMEFDISGYGSVSAATLEFSITNVTEDEIYGTSKDFSIAYYSGTGATDFSAFNSGTLLYTLTVADPGVGNYSVDVTGIYNAFVTSGDDYLGIRFYGPVWSDASSVGDQIIFNEGSLEISSVPEPATGISLLLGFAGYGVLRKKLKK